MLSASRAVRAPSGGACGGLRGRLAGAFGVSVAVALVFAHGALGAPARAFREFPIPASTSHPGGIAVGREGDLWFTETHTNAIARITPSGKFSAYPLPAHSSPTGIVAAPEGSLWFTEANDIGRITPSGKISQFPIPPTEVFFSPIAPLLSGSSPYAITLGPEGNLWFPEWFADKIGRITPSGTISQFQIPTGASRPYGITAGPDGNLWFTEEHGDKIGRITPGGAISEFQIPSANAFPFGITHGPDGNLWFTEYFGNKIGRITPSGAISEFQIPSYNSYPSSGITVGREGNLWFTEESADKIGRITTGGTVSEFPVPTAKSHPTAITASPNGNLWFTELIGNNIGLLRPRLLRCVVPKLKGKTLAQARKLLEQGQCVAGKVLGAGSHKHNLVVISQVPAARKVLPFLAKVSLRLG